MDFCRAYNSKTAGKELEGLIIPVVITVYGDRSYSFITKTPPAAVLLKRAAGIAKGSGVPNRDKVGNVTAKQVEEIARNQNAGSERQLPGKPRPTASRGTARSMGIEVVS